MATTRPFAYNPSAAPVVGATQFGNLAIGDNTVDYSTNPGELQWFIGPDEDPGYVVALAVTGGNFPTPSGSNNGTVQFWRTEAKTDPSFLSLANVISYEHDGPGPFATINDAQNWLGTANFWTAYGGSGAPGGTGPWRLFATYSPADFTGSITFPAHPTVPGPGGTSSNKVNLLGGSTGALYINSLNITGDDQQSFLDNLIGRTGTITLEQNGYYATYSFVPDTFEKAVYGGSPNFQYFHDPVYPGPGDTPQPLVLVTPSGTATFDFVNDINISIT